MPTLTAPLLSLSASGTFGGEITYVNTPNGTIARHRVKPKNPQSLPQTFQRQRLALLSHMWHTLTIEQKATWAAIAKAHKYSNFNAFTAANMDRLATDRNPFGTPNGVGATITGVIDSVDHSDSLGHILVTVALSTQMSAHDTLILTLSTSEGANTTGHTHHRLIASQIDLEGLDTIEFDVTVLPPGTWFISTQLLASDGSSSAYEDIATAFTILPP